MGASTMAITVAAGPALAQSAASANVIQELVVTAEKREQNLQDVPVAVSAFTSAKRELIGINSIQDMTNFTPGLQYNSSTDRISLRGVGRQTNVLSADSSVANYNDGVYETFAVQAGRSTLFLDRVEVLRGPQGTLYGRNAIGGALNEISKKPTETPFGEVRVTYGSYNHSNIEAAYSGPITEGLQFRLAGNWEKQTDGWIDNIVPGMPDEGGVMDQWFEEGQLQAKFGERFEGWIKVAGGQWRNGAGGPGSQSGGWTPAPYPTFEIGNGGIRLNAGYGCNPNGLATNVVNLSPAGCVNPAVNSPWTIARAVPYKVTLPVYATLASQWVWHADNFDIKYVTGGVKYHYILTGPTGPDGLINTSAAPITAFTLPGGLVVHPAESFVYQEYNSFWSHEINLISTTDKALQWVAGAYYFKQDERQPVYTTNPEQAQWNGPFALPSVFCGQTAGVCAAETGFRRFDNKPDFQSESYAAFGQIDWKLSDTWKTTIGLRYSHDRKTGSESVRLLCFAVCLGPPELLPSGVTIDLTQLPSVVSAPPPGQIPTGVVGPTTYDPATGMATRRYDASWEAVTGTAGLEWSPDEDTMAYAKYSRGYKAGGFNSGIFTVLNPIPWTDKEGVDSFEVGLKKNFGPTLQTNIAIFYYAYQDMQIPISRSSTGAGPGTSGSQVSTQFYNVPKAISAGIELESTWQPL
ncbi:MAG: TonB-dependent receptor, partial [Phenylobacterium sp.]